MRARNLPVALISLPGLLLFLWPFLGSDLPASTPAWTLMLATVSALLLVEVGTRQLDSRGLALLAAIAAIDTVLRLAVIEGIGGFSPIYGSFSNAELYNPTTGTFSLTRYGMTARRELFTATRLPNGKVLLVGGMSANSNQTTRTAEIYDPATGRFTATGSMQTPNGRFGHEAFPRHRGGDPQ